MGINETFPDGATAEVFLLNKIILEQQNVICLLELYLAPVLFQDDDFIKSSAPGVFGQIFNQSFT